MRGALILCLLAAAVCARADLYTWTDARGVTHFSSSPPSKTAEKRKVAVIKSGAGARGAASASPAYEKEGAAAVSRQGEGAAPPTVELYTTAWCPHCREARDYLSSRGVSYQDYDIETDKQAYQRYRGYGGNGVPLAVIGGQSVNGFSPGAYARLLAGPGR